MNQIAAFNLQLARIDRLGYQKEMFWPSVPGWDVSRGSLPVASLSPAHSSAGSLEGRKLARPVRKQVHRTNYTPDCELTPGQLRKRRKNQRYQAMLRAQRDLFALGEES